MSCIVPVADLEALAKKMRSDGMDYVSVEFLEADLSDPDDPLPPCLHFEAFRASSPFDRVDYSDIEAIGNPSTI